MTNELYATIDRLEKEIETLKAHISMASTLIKQAPTAMHHTKHVANWEMAAEEWRVSTPSTSLATHDAAIWNEAADVCHALLTKPLALTSEAYHNNGILKCAEALRQKAKGEAMKDEGVGES